VLEWIRRLHSRHPGVHVLCARSLPGGEGERMAEQLAGVKVGAEALNDDAALDAVAVSTWVVVGADALEAARFWNKVGTRELLRRAAASGRPVLVIAETAKWCHPSWELAPQTPQTAPGVFEPTDNQLVTFFVTDRGSWPPGALASHLDTPPCFSPLVSGP
jgi:translation initiation factor 2B subunit (eIF-2B alpha/beta/delta family)